MKRLTLHLCSPLQSYGYKDYEKIRRTKQNPTHSAITGIIACCGGIKRGDNELKKIAKSFKIVNIKRLKTPKYPGEEVLQTGPYEISTEFQIAKPTKENPIYRADDEIYKNNMLIYREYIQDAYFQVEIEAKDEDIDLYKNWLLDPYWPPYLGRKCCVPAIPIVLE